MEEIKHYFVIQYPLWEIETETLGDLYKNFVKQIRDTFGERYGVIMIPNSFQLTSLTREQLNGIINSIFQIMESKDDSDSETGTGSEDCG